MIPTLPRAATLAATLALALAGPLAAETALPGQHFVENWDFDGDGKVSVAEATERRDDIFTTFDANEDNLLDAAEYDLFDEARANDMEANRAAMGGQVAGGGMGGYERSMSREASDLDADGTVTRDEFVGGTPAWFANRDRDADGFITPADFGPAR